MTTISIDIGVRSFYWYHYFWYILSDSSVSGPEEIRFNGKTTGFKYVTHRFTCEDECDLEFLIPNRENKGHNNLKLFKNGDGLEEETIKFEKGKNKVYVFFYGDDPRPLMFCYGKEVYRPIDKGNYFRIWEEVTQLKGCEFTGTGGESEVCDMLLKALVGVSDFLNPVNIKEVPSKKEKPSCSYEVHEFKGEKITIKVESVQATEKFCYHRYTHTPEKSGFRLGVISYGVCIKLNEASGTNNCITSQLVDASPYTAASEVVVYYYKEDTKLLDPLLVALKVSNGTYQPYYELQKSDGASFLPKRYKKGDGPITLEDTPGCELEKKLNTIRYNLKQVVQIKLEQNCPGSYTSMGRAPSITSPTGFLPLNSDKQVNVEECKEGTCAQLNKGGYRCYRHKLTGLGPDVLHKIGGVAFTIPGTSHGSVLEIKLFNDTTEATFKNGERGVKGKIDPLTYNKCMGDVCVYFYGEDPRPLMLCYNKKAYIPLDKELYFEKWVKVCDVNKCECTGGSCDGCDKLLTALVKVSDFLNPVRIDNVPLGCRKCRFYTIHWFGGCSFRIKVEKNTSAKDGFCYNGYTHTHFGICCNGEGFRLGKIRYRGTCIKENNNKVASNGNKCIKLNGTGNANAGTCITSVLDNESAPDKYKSADQVIVYYYGGERDYKNPLLVALYSKDSPDKCTLYYELILSSSSTRVGSDTDPKRYTKCTNSITLCETSGSEIKTRLDNIMCQIRKTLQIILEKRPMPKLYCPETNPDKTPFKCEEREINHQSPSDAKGSNNDNFIKASYQARLYDSNSSQAKNGSGTTTETTTPTTSATSNCNSTPTLSASRINVSEIKCMELSRLGYRCYMHDIVNAKFIVEIGWLRFFLWDNRKDKGTSSTCRELCLYGPNSGVSTSVTQGSSCTTAVATSTQPVQASCATDSNLELIPNFPYTTCKGNVYVYFYGDDPRPLMLCYGGNAYGPRCLAEYDCRWVGVVNEGVTSSLVQVY